MKNYLFATLLVLATVHSLHASAKRELYLSIGASYEAMTEAQGGVAAVIEAGVPLFRLGRHEIGMEGVVTHSALPPSIDCCKVTMDVTATTAALYVSYALYLNQRLYFKPRIGAAYRSYSTELSGDTARVSITERENDVGPVYGVGAGVRLNHHLDVYADYTLMDGSDYAQATLGLRYRLSF